LGLKILREVEIRRISHMCCQNFIRKW